MLSGMWSQHGTDEGGEGLLGTGGSGGGRRRSSIGARFSLRSPGSAARRTSGRRDSNISDVICRRESNASVVSQMSDGMLDSEGHSQGGRRGSLRRGSQIERDEARQHRKTLHSSINNRLALAMKDEGGKGEKHGLSETLGGFFRPGRDTGEEGH